MSGTNEFDAIEAHAGALPGDPSGEDGSTEIADDRLQLLGASLAKRRDEWVKARGASGVEKRWAEDSDQYNGIDAANRDASGAMMDSVQQGGFPTSEAEQKPTRSTVFVNITRPKTNTAEARLANMLLPTDDRNWGIKPTPVPSLTSAAEKEAQTLAVQQAQQAGQQPAMFNGPQLQAPQKVLAQQPGTATAQLQESVKRAKAMEAHIDDQLTECDYNGQTRLMLHDAAVLGTGVMKGPIVVNRTRRAWRKAKDASGAELSPAVYELEIAEEKSPASVRVDPRYVYPDPGCGDNVQRGAGIFEMKTCTGKELRDLVEQPGYIEEAIAAVLREGPKNSASIGTTMDQRRRADGALALDELFEVWEYWGMFTPDDLRAAGVGVDDGMTGMVSGCIIMVNQHVIKGFLNPLETGDLPYDFYVWEPADGSVHGYGVPHLLKSQQRVLNAAWRQLMDNAGLSVGPQIVIDPTKIRPADGRMEITGRKIWYAMDPTTPLNQVFDSFDIVNHGDELLKVIDMTMKFMDMEASTPELMQGEKGNAPETLGGMILLQNSSNVVLTRQVKGFDDRVTRPHIRRYYDWNMEHAEGDEIKGDFNVDARGSSALLVRDIQGQALLQLGAFAGNGVIGPMVNWAAWFKETLKAQRLDPSAIMKTDAEIEALAHQPQQASPDQVRAQAQLMVAKTKVQGELAYADKMHEIERNSGSTEIMKMQLQRELALIELSEKRGITLEQAKLELAKAAMQEDTKRQVAAINAKLDQDQHHANLAVDVAKHQQNAAHQAAQAAANPIQPAQGA